jgi:hypothetical protein
MFDFGFLGTTYLFLILIPLIVLFIGCFVLDVYIGFFLIWYKLLHH